MSMTRPRAKRRLRLGAPAAVLLATALSCGLAPAQPRFRSVVIDDAPVLEGTPRTPRGLAEGNVFICRLALSPEARAGLGGPPGHRHAFTRDPAAPGPVIYSLDDLHGIPGDPRLRVEINGTGIHALGIGATVAESLAAARDEPLRSAILVGVHPEAELPAPWQRVGEAAARPVVWASDILTSDHRQEGSRRWLSLMDAVDWQVEVSRTPTADFDLFRWTAALHAEDAGRPQHLQGVAIDPEFHVYWSWTDRLVKTDTAGQILVEVEAPDHQGDLCWHDGKVVVAVNHGKFNDPDEAHDSYAYVYDAATLELLERHPLPEARYGAGGICRAGGHWVVVTGLPVELADDPRAANEVHLYDDAFHHVRTVWLPGGWTRLGIQTATYASGRFLFGCYGSPRVTLVASPDLQHVRRIEGLDCAYGVAAIPGGGVVLATDTRDAAGLHHGRLTVRAVSGLH